MSSSSVGFRAMLLCCLLAFLPVSGASFLASIFGSHMVLQREPQSACIWGWTDPAASVVVQFKGKAFNSTAAADGAWTTCLPPTPAGGPYSIAIKSSSGESALLDDVLFGDVWVCSGQSNMEFVLPYAFGGNETMANASSAYPDIRVFTVGHWNMSEQPLDDFPVVVEPWSVPSSSSLGNVSRDFGWFSAVCWYHAQTIYDSVGVPLGLVSSNQGGTTIRVWASRNVSDRCNSSSVEVAPHKASVPPPGNPQCYDAGCLYNAMIYPITRLRIRGVLWYQAEADVGQAAWYSCMFPAMITQWRQAFGYAAAELPFVFAQLHPWPAPTDNGTGLAQMRLAQLSALALPNVYFATAIDLGDLDSPLTPIHPRYKQPIGRRLALASLANVYGQQNVVFEGPMAIAMDVNASGPVGASVVVEFDAESIGSGLVMRSAECPSGLAPENCAGFEMLASDRKWYPAVPSLDDGNGYVVVLTANLPDGLEAGGGARFGYANWPICTLYNVEGLPAVPFVIFMT